MGRLARIFGALRENESMAVLLAQLSASIGPLYEHIFDEKSGKPAQFDAAVLCPELLQTTSLSAVIPGSPGSPLENFIYQIVHAVHETPADLLTEIFIRVDNSESSVTVKTSPLAALKSVLKVSFGSVNDFEKSADLKGFGLTAIDLQQLRVLRKLLQALYDLTDSSKRLEELEELDSKLVAALEPFEGSDEKTVAAVAGSAEPAPAVSSLQALIKEASEFICNRCNSQDDISQMV
jgi:hypothetical protein